jgi:hypothetical protein
MYICKGLQFILGVQTLEGLPLEGRNYTEWNLAKLEADIIFQVICGTDSYPANFRAKKYKIKDKFFTKTDLQFMMRNLQMKNQMLLKSSATGWSCPPPRGRPATCRPPPGCSSPREGHWGGTWAAEGSLANRLLLTDFSSFDELGHVTNPPCSAPFLF